jgi:hypothetical protein
MNRVVVDFLIEIPTTMKLHNFLFASAVCLALLLSHVTFYAKIAPGFYIPDDVREVTFSYKTFKNLIILPVIINDTVKVNLILDTGCRNLVLFGKRFKKLFAMEPDKKVKFSGLGSGNPVYGGLSLKNKVTIKEVLGDQIPVVIVGDRNVFESFTRVDGVIGYDIFIKFEIELNPQAKLITFRPALSAFLAEDYTHVPIRIEDSRPILTSQISLNSDVFACAVMIDTGSSLGLLLKTTDLKKFSSNDELSELGRGFNGIVNGFKTKVDFLALEGFSLSSLNTGIIHSPWHNHASIGMEVLKGYSVVLNYCKGYVGFRRPKA